MTERAPFILMLTDSSRLTAERIKTVLPGARIAGPDRLISDEPFEAARMATQDAFRQGRPIIGLCAAGILIRFLADLLGHKSEDAPVIAVSDRGDHVVPLLGGHHGANDMARKIAAATGGTAAITTAGDNRFGIAFDSPPDGYRLVNADQHKSFVRRLLEGEKLKPLDDPLFPSEALSVDPAGALEILVSESEADGPDCLIYAPQKYVLGLGCERNASTDHVQGLVDQVLAEADILPEAVAAVATIDLKHDEVAIRAMAALLDVPLCLYPADRLEAETDRLENPSDVVFREVGCHGVAEAASLVTAGPEARLFVPKRKTAKATCALASDQTILTKSILDDRCARIERPSRKEFSS